MYAAVLSRFGRLRPAAIALHRLGITAILLFAACHREPTAEQPSTLPTLSAQIQRCCDGHSKEIVVRETTVGDQQLAEILRATDVEVLELYQCAALTNLQGIEQLGRLRRLRLEDFACDDAAAMRLAKLPELVSINLPRATFTDRGLAALAALPKLQQLRFSSAHVSDQGMFALAASPVLRFLHLIQVPITDDGLRAFHGMQQLESFYIDGGSTTDTGIKQLLTALPELHFHRDQLHLPDDPRADGH